MMFLTVMRQVIFKYFFFILGLYWDFEPSKTLAQGPLFRKKKSKKRVILLLACNATRTEKLKPFFIYTYQNSRILYGKKRRNYQLIIIGIQLLGCKFQYGIIILQNWIKKCDYKIIIFFYLLIMHQCIL